MAETSATITKAEPEHSIGQRVQQRFPAWHHLALGGITLISVFMNFFLLNSFNGGGQIPPQILDRIPQQLRNRPQGGFGGQQSALSTWLTQHCKTVPTSLWQSSSTSAGSSGFGRGGANQLYDCAITH